MKLLLTLSSGADLPPFDLGPDFSTTDQDDLEFQLKSGMVLKLKDPKNKDLIINVNAQHVVSWSFIPDVTTTTQTPPTTTLNPNTAAVTKK